MANRRMRVTAKGDDLSNPEDAENLRTEYESLSSFLTTVVTFRFTVLGFFLAAVGLLLSTGLTPLKAIALLVIDISLYIAELRNRSLSDNIADRGIQIEREHWGYVGARAYRPLFSHMNKTAPLNDPLAPQRPGPDYPRFFNGRLTVPIAFSHGCALDVLYFGMGVLCVLYLLYAMARSILACLLPSLGA